MSDIKKVIPDDNLEDKYVLDESFDRPGTIVAEIIRVHSFCVQSHCSAQQDAEREES